MQLTPLPFFLSISGSSVNKRRSRLLCYALVISIALVLMGFVAMGVRAFASAGVSNTMFFVAAGIVVLVPVVYFVCRPVRQAAINPGIFEAAQTYTGFGRDRRKPAVSGHQSAAITIERRRKQRSMPVSSLL